MLAIDLLSLFGEAAMRTDKGFEPLTRVVYIGDEEQHTRGVQRHNRRDLLEQLTLFVRLRQNMTRLAIQARVTGATVSGASGSCQKRASSSSIAARSTGCGAGELHAIGIRGFAMRVLRFDQSVSFQRSPASRRILRQEAAPPLLPGLQNVGDPGPGDFHRIPAHKQRGITGHDVQQ